MARYAHSVGSNPDGIYKDAAGFGPSRNNVLESNIYYGGHLNPPADAGAITGHPMLANPGTGRDT